MAKIPAGACTLSIGMSRTKRLKACRASGLLVHFAGFFGPSRLFFMGPENKPA
jgi:hypothetical protein